ncbi:MAG: hypothetical protein JXA24_07195 [Proteobacteria bacterium]|nr:hypothetical protein [Pseudomonadota bacterium]
MTADPKTTAQGNSRQGYDLRELMTPGHEACPGCGAAMALRLALKALGPDCALVVPRSCVASSLGPFPFSAVRLPLLHVPAGTAAASASGLRAALDLSGREAVKVVAWGDRDDAFGPGLAHLMTAAGRNERIIYVCCDTKRPGEGNARPPVDAISALRGGAIPYFATTTPALPLDLDSKFKTAASADGFCFLHLLAACPPEWGIDPSGSVRAMREAALSGRFPLSEAPGTTSPHDGGR